MTVTATRIHLFNKTRATGVLKSFAVDCDTAKWGTGQAAWESHAKHRVTWRIPTLNEYETDRM